MLDSRGELPVRRVKVARHRVLTRVHAQLGQHVQMVPVIRQPHVLLPAVFHGLHRVHGAFRQPSQRFHPLSFRSDPCAQLHIHAKPFLSGERPCCKRLPGQSELLALCLRPLVSRQAQHLARGAAPQVQRFSAGFVYGLSGQLRHAQPVQIFDTGVLCHARRKGDSVVIVAGFRLLK